MPNPFEKFGYAEELPAPEKNKTDANPFEAFGYDDTPSFGDFEQLTQPGELPAEPHPDAAAWKKDFEPKRTWGQAVIDSAIGFNKGLASVADSVANTGDFVNDALHGPGVVWKDGSYMPQLVEHEEYNRLRNQGMSTPADATGAAVDYFEGLKSPAIRNDAKHVANADGYVDTVKRLWDRPAAIGNAIADSFAFAIPGFAAARAARAAGLGAKGIAGATAATGAVLEGGGARAEAVDDVMSLPLATLIERSPDFNAYVQANLKDPNDPAARQKIEDEARRKVAADAGFTAQALTMPVSFLASKLTGAAKAEADFFTGEGVKGFFRGLGGQFIEETAQEAGAQAAVNAGVRQNADSSRDYTQGLGNAAAMGGIVGASQQVGMSAGKVAADAYSRLRNGGQMPQSPMEEAFLQQQEQQPQEQQAEPLGLGYNPRRMITMPDGTTAWESDLPAIEKAAQQQAVASRHSAYPAFSEIDKTPDEIEGELLGDQDIDAQIAALQADLELIRARGRALPRPEAVSTPDQTMAVTPGGTVVPQYLADQALRSNREVIGQAPASAAAHPAFAGPGSANVLDTLIPAPPQAEPKTVRDVYGERADAAAERAKSIRLGSILPPGFDDPRLARDEFRQSIEGLVNTLEKGGGISYLRDENDVITGRTQSVNPGWFQAMAKDSTTAMSVEDTRAAVAKALKGERLGVRQTRVVKSLLDEVSGIRSNYAGVLRDNRKQVAQERAKAFWDAVPNDGQDDYGLVQESIAERFNEANYLPEASYDDRATAELADQAMGLGASWDDIDAAIASGNGQESTKALGRLIYGLRNEHRKNTTAGQPAAGAGGIPGDVRPRDSSAPAESLAKRAADPSQAGQADRSGIAPSADAVAAIANESPSSPLNDLPEPTEAQKEAGNYRKPVVRLHGLDIAIENPKGSVRRGVDPNGKAWESPMHAHYGYVKRSQGADGDAVDVFVGDKPDSQTVFVIDQQNADGTFDEHKVVMGTNTMLEAKVLYKKNYQKGWQVGPATAMSVDEFKAWLKNGDTTQPLQPDHFAKAREKTGQKPNLDNQKPNLDNSLSKSDGDLLTKELKRLVESGDFETDGSRAAAYAKRIQKARDGDASALAWAKDWLSKLDGATNLDNELTGQQPTNTSNVKEENSSQNLPGDFGAGLVGQLAGMAEDDLAAMIDSIAGELDSAGGLVDTSAPVAKRPRKTQGAKPRLKKTRTKAELADTQSAADVSRAAGEIAKSLGVNLGKGGMNALEGLTKLFGGPGRANSGLSFDEQTYAQAKPHFDAMLADFTAAGKDLKDLIRAMLEAFGLGIKPYIIRYAKDLGGQNAASSGDQLDSQNRANEQQAARDDIQPNEPAGAGRRAGQADQRPGDNQSLFDSRLPNIEAPAGRAGSGSGRRGSRPGSGESVAGSADDGRGAEPGDSGLPPGSSRDGGIEGALAKAAELAPPIYEYQGKPKTADLAQIKAAMPFLTDGQANDVAFAERRFADPNGQGGVLFTNGTGTGKTFSGLGIVKRQLMAGKKNILIVTRSQPIVDAWVKAGAKFFGVNISVLKSTKDKGGGVSATTYANFGENNEIGHTEWDVVLCDESHYLSSSESGAITDAKKALDAITGRNASRLFEMQNAEEYARAKELRERAESLGETDNQRDRALADILAAQAGAMRASLEKRAEEFIKKNKNSDRANVVFLSATPFAYVKSLDYAQGYLFDWGGDKDGLGYNSGNNREQFYMQNFGYRMRYNRLTQPDAKVNQRLMERNFNAMLKKTGALSGRMLESDFDYDRRFVLTESAIGRRVDQALDWLNEMSRGGKSPEYSTLNSAINHKDRFDYLQRMYFLESIKAQEALPIIRAHLNAGRNVLVIHDYKKGSQKGNPFAIDERLLDSDAARAYREFYAEFSDLIRAFDRLPSAIDALTGAGGFPDALIYNGDFSGKKRIALQEEFNDPKRPPQVMIAQGDAMREGVSIHDTIGDRQRVLIHLGMPTKPTAAIQQEGRIYRTGQRSNAIFRYLTIGTNWERYAFASKIAGRADTAESLAMGEQARGLKEAFIDAYEDAQDWPVGHEGEGTGGKEIDRAMGAVLTEWDAAKSYYYGTKKQGSGRAAKGREGDDYFATPEPIGLKMVQWSGAAPGDDVLEPSAGHGAISRWFPEGSKIRVIEKSQELASRLMLRTDGDVVAGTFEAHHIMNKYDAIVMNPPFGRGGALAMQHLSKAVNHLREGGRVVALIPTGPAADKAWERWFYAKDEKGRSELGDLHLVMDVMLPRSVFERAGTQIPSRIVVIEKIDEKSPHLGKVAPTKRLSYAGDLELSELFDRIESLEAPPKATPLEVEQYANSKPKARETATANAVAENNKIVTDAPEVEYTTKKGKLLKGVLLDMPLDKAREIDKYSWITTINGVKGAFVRMDYIERPKFSLGAGVDTGGVTKADVEPVIARIAKSFGGRKINVMAVDSLVELPPEVKAGVEADGVDQSKVRGIFHKGKIFINLTALNTPADIERVILHELAHDGLAKMFGPEIQRAMGGLYLAIGGDKTLRALATKHAMPLDRYEQAYANASPGARIALMTEELLAHIAQDSRPTVMRKLRELVGAIRLWLREHGFLKSADVSESELFALLKEVRQYSGGDGDIRFSLAASGQIEVGGVMRPTTNSNGQPIATTEEALRNFWEWFGDSKVVDEQGRPLVVYHSSGADFTEFQQSADGELGAGIYLTADQNYSNMIAGMREQPTTYPVYVALRNPLRVQGSARKAVNVATSAEIRDKAERLGYDGIIQTLPGNKTMRQIVAFRPKQIKSATGNRGTFDPGDPDIRFSLDPNEKTRPRGGFSASGLAKKAADVFKTSAEKEADLRRENLAPEIRGGIEALGDSRTMLQKAISEIKRQLKPGGLLPGNIFKLKIERDGEFNAHELEASVRVQALHDAVEAAFKKPYEELHPEIKARINSALRGEPQTKPLPQEISDALAKMREHITRLSVAHLEQLHADAQRLIEEGDEPAAAAKARLIETIMGNLDTYLHRSYKAFDDPDWPNKVRRLHPDIYEAAVRYLAEGYADGEAPGAEHFELARKKANLMLEEGTAFDSVGAFIAESKLGAKDLGIIKKRKDIAPEIRALLGEYEDAPVNYVKSATKMTRLVFNHAFLTKMREAGFAAGLFSQARNTNLDHNKQIAGEASEVYAPLNGLYTSHEFHQALVDALGREQMAWWYRAIVTANGLVKYGKTVLSPTTAMRNFYSAMFFSLANGHFNFGHGKRFSWSTYFKSQDAGLEYFAKLRRLGVVYDSPYAGEMMALLKDSRLDETVFNWKPFKWGRAAVDFAQRFYGFGDDLWKIIGFENEKRLLLSAKPGLTEEAAEKEAAERIRNTYPTYSMTPRFINSLRRFPLMGTFVSFPAEIIRTSYHIVNYYARDVRDYGPKSRLVQQKTLGLIIATSAMAAIQAISRAIAGVDDDEEEALRLLSPEWQKNSNLMYLGRDKNGALQTMDMSFLDPYGYWKRPINAVLQNQPLDEAIKSGARDVLAPFFGQGIAFGAIMDAAMNKKDSGGRVFNPEDDAARQALDIAGHIGKAVQPGVINNITRLHDAAVGRVTASGRRFDVGDELAGLVGFRWGTFEPRTALYYQTFGFLDRKRDSAKLLTEAMRDPNKVTDEELREAFDRSMKARERAYNDIIKVANAAKASGMSVLQVQLTLKNSGVSQDDARDIARGKVPAWRYTKGSGRGAIKKAQVLFDKEVAEEFKRREAFVRGLKD